MSKVPDSRESREVEPQPGTLGAFLAFVQLHGVSPDTLLCVYDHDVEATIPWDRIDYKVSTEVADEIVLFQ